MTVKGLGRKNASEFNLELSLRMHSAEQAALLAVGRISKAN